MRAMYVTPSLEAFGPIVDIEITASSALRAAMRQSTFGPRVKASSLIDTGASGTVLIPQVFQKLGIHPHDAAEIRTPGQPKPTTRSDLSRGHFSTRPPGCTRIRNAKCSRDRGIAGRSTNARSDRTRSLEALCDGIPWTSESLYAGAAPLVSGEHNVSPKPAAG